MRRLHCGIDCGTTNVKVVLIDDEGRSVATRAVPTPRAADPDGVSTDALALVGTLEEMILDAWRTAGGGAPLRSIAVAGVGEDGTGVLDDMTPTGLAIAWFDRRASAEAAELRALAGDEARAGIAVAADRTAAKWLWTRRHRPGDLARAHTWIALTDFPAAWWTGNAFMSGTLAARTACFDVYSRRWLPDLLAAAGAPPLPPLADAGDVVGTVNRGRILSEGAAADDTLVVAGGHDHPVAALAIRSVDGDARVDSLGTANLVYGEADGPVPPRLDPWLAFSVPPRSQAGVACLGVYEFSAALAPDAASRERLIAMLAASRLPGRPCSEANGPAAGQRRELEHACFVARRMLEAIDEAGAAPGEIYATGGWARSRALLELRASIYGRPVHAIEEPELAAVGAACLGVRATTGRFPDLCLTRHVRRVDPAPDWAGIFADAYPDVKGRLDLERERADEPE